MAEWGYPVFCLMLCGLAALFAQRFAMGLAVSGTAKRGKNLLSRLHLAAPQSLWGDTLAFAAGLQIACLFLLCSARPGASLVLTLGVILLLLVINYYKENILHESLVVADAMLLVQVFKYPHLYFPFLPMKRICCVLALLLLGIAVLVRLEFPVPFFRSFVGVGLLLAVACFPVFLFSLTRRGYALSLAEFLLRRCPVTHDPMSDARQSGALTAALLYPAALGKLMHAAPDFLADYRQRPAAASWPGTVADIFTLSQNGAGGKAPHIALVQAESFLDIRPWLSPPQQGALKDFLPHWDALSRQKRALPTPEQAFGAYTMRTEFAMLTGLRAAPLGVLEHNPYLLAARRPLWSLARHLASKGYDTVCMHPYAKDFFQRDKVMPNLGFHHFLGVEELGHLPRFGPYTSDTALAEYALSRMRAAEVPVFCFLISMEAHGPWQAGRLAEQQIARTLHDIDRSLFSLELQMYLCHLRHMDEMFGILNQGMQNALTAGRGGFFWAYGDHAPECLSRV